MFAEVIMISTLGFIVMFLFTILVTWVDEDWRTHDELYGTDILPLLRNP